MTKSNGRKKRQSFTFKAGDVFGRLTYTGLTYIKNIHGSWRRFIEARCVCGTVRDFVFQSVANGATKSCGCLKKETTSKMARKHSLSGHPLFTIWQNVKARCYSENTPQYRDYGGRGIEMWADWKDDFFEFYEWCMSNGYSEELSLDRKDNGGNYAPYNCRFATRAEQSRNTRRNRFYTAFGETKCLFDWAKDERCAVTIWGLRKRADSSTGLWVDFEKALTTPPLSLDQQATKRLSNRNLTAFGETKCMTEWLRDKRCTVKIDSLRDRLNKGWDDEKAISFPRQPKHLQNI